MRKALRIDDDVLVAVRSLAHRQGWSVSEMVSARLGHRARADKA